jgi:hypothetical protein
VVLTMPMVSLAARQSERNGNVHVDVMSEYQEIGHCDLNKNDGRLKSWRSHHIKTLHSIETCT